MSLSHRGIGNQQFDRSAREPREAVIRTTSGLTLRGTVYLIPSTRLTDLVERDTENFIAMTGVTVTSADGHVERASFLAVNKTQIVTLEDAEVRYFEEPDAEGADSAQARP